MGERGVGSSLERKRCVASVWTWIWVSVAFPQRCQSSEGHLEAQKDSGHSTCWELEAGTTGISGAPRLGASLDVDVTSDPVSRAPVHTCVIHVLHEDAGPQRQEVAKSSLRSARQAMPHDIGVPPPRRGVLSQQTQRCHMSWQCPCWYLSPAWETDHL